MASHQAVSAFDNTLARVARDLDQLKVSWALIGGIAVSARGAPRFTSDIDVAVIVTADKERERLIQELLQLRYEVEALLEDTESGELNTVRLWCPSVSGTQLLVDLMFATTGIEREAVDTAVPLNVTPRIAVQVVTLACLLAMKVLSAGNEGRSRDEDDLQQLIKRATNGDITEARRLLDLITERGRNRGKDLQLEFEGYLERFRPEREL